MGERLADVNADLIRDWYVREAKRSPRQAARSAAMFSGFLRWCSLQREFRDLVDARAASADALRDLLPGKKRRTDALELGQLAAWFAGVAKLSSPVARAYLTALVLTGARREEMAALRWDAVDFRWRKLTIADKVGDTRTIPLTPYVQALLEGLPRATLPDGAPNPYVFSSLGKSGRIAEPRSPHQQVLTDAGIPHVSIHGLRRTFALMGEQAGAPAGAIAQVMGHRPSAVHEGYKPRSVDALRPYLERVESFVLQAAGVDFTQPERRGAGLRLVVGAAG
jgi:integrase